jgi:hypothetical protein
MPAPKPISNLITEANYLTFINERQSWYCAASRLAVRRFRPRGVLLQEPRQCSIAFPEPCWPCGIRTNEQRALTAAVLSCTLTPAGTESHRVFNPAPPEAELAYEVMDGDRRTLAISGPDGETVWEGAADLGDGPRHPHRGGAC